MGAEVIKQVVYTAMFVVLVVTAAVIVRTFTVKPRTILAPPCTEDESGFIRADKEMIKRFQTSLKFETISWEPGVYNVEELLNIQEFIKSCMLSFRYLVWKLCVRV